MWFQDAVILVTVNPSFRCVYLDDEVKELEPESWYMEPHPDCANSNTSFASINKSPNIECYFLNLAAILLAAG